MAGIQDRLGDLSWLGDAYADQGWVQVPEPTPPEPTEEELKATALAQIEYFLETSLPMVASDNMAITKGQRADWTEYRRLLCDVPSQRGFPRNIFWPSIPA
jgi:hypothetical protein